MFNFFRQMKQKLGSSQHQQQPTYKQYTHAELKIIAMRTRMVLQQVYKKQKAKVGHKDSQFKKLQTSQMGIDKQYEVLQQIGRKVVEVQSIKLLNQMLRKIEAYSPQIINTKGDIALMKQQLAWFQCILWYRRCKKLTNLQQFNTFCFNFFKGVDITQELNIKCQLFNVYEELKYLEGGEVLPMDYLVGKVVGEVSFQITEEELEKMREINKKEIKEKEMKKQQEKRNINPLMQNNKQFPQQQQYINPQQQQYTNPQQQQYLNPQQPQNNINQYQPQFIPYNNQYVHPNINNFLPYNNINNPQGQTNPNYNPFPNKYPHDLDNTSSQLPFLPPKEQPQSAPIIIKKPLDDEFAMDIRYTRKYESSIPITPILPTTIQQKQQQQQQQKQFKSSQLNLIDWQSMYSSNNQRKKQQQSNPYINSSNIGLLNDQHWTSSQSNLYDAASLPYPPSGVIPMSEVKYHPDNKFYVDTLEKYQSQPVIYGSSDDSGNNNSRGTFIQGIESKFFTNTNTNNKKPAQQLSEDELLLREIQRQSYESNKQQQKQIYKQQKPKSFNKLFGMKMKSSNPIQELPVIAPITTPPSHPDIYQQSNQNKQQQQQTFPNLNLRQFISSYKQPQFQQSIVKQLEQDEIERYLKQQQENQKHQDDSNQISDIERQMSRVNIDKSSIQSYNKNDNQEQNINHDIRTLIETKKQLIQRQQSCQYMNDDDVDDYTQPNNNNDEQTPNQQQQQQQNRQQAPSQPQHHHIIYPVDNQRLDSSTIRYSQQGLCESNNYYQQQQQKQSIAEYQNNPSNQVSGQSGNDYYVGLDADLLDSLNIIRRHFGQDVATNQQQQAPQTKKSQSSLSIKKPYMVSIYARQNYLDSLTQIKKKLSSPK